VTVTLLEIPVGAECEPCRRRGRPNIEGTHQVNGDQRADVTAILSGDGNTLRSGAPTDWPFEPEAYLREPFNSDLPCVGEDYEVVGSSCI
jgi:hypothetical protein